MTVLIDVIKNTPLAIITELIDASRTQIDRISDAVLDMSCLANDVEFVLDTNALINEKLEAFGADERQCLTTLAQLRSGDTDFLPVAEHLDDAALDQLRQTLMQRLVIHLVDLRIAMRKLQRGLELNRAAMIERFAIFAVAGLSQDGASGIVSARAFVVAYLVAAQLKDRLECAGYRWTGEKTLITLYLNAVGCERRRSKDRFVADPIASLIATRLGFRSAKQLHRELYAWHAEKNGSNGSKPNGHISFDPMPCVAFRREYLASPVSHDVYSKLMERLRNSGAAC